MKNKANNDDVLRIFRDFQYVLEHKPSLNQMFKEIRMMKFKVKPMQGDIAFIDLQNDKLIEVLWNLGKLDELFQKEYPKLTNQGKDVFFRIFEGMYQKLQTELNSINLRKQKPSARSSIFEMEIFKENNDKNKLN